MRCARYGSTRAKGMHTQGSWVSRFLQLVPGEGESQTTGKLCVLHYGTRDRVARGTSEPFPVETDSRAKVYALAALYALGPHLDVAKNTQGFDGEWTIK